MPIRHWIMVKTLLQRPFLLNLCPKSQDLPVSHFLFIWFSWLRYMNNSNHTGYKLLKWTRGGHSKANRVEYVGQNSVASGLTSKWYACVRSASLVCDQWRRTCTFRESLQPLCLWHLRRCPSTFTIWIQFKRLSWTTSRVSVLDLNIKSPLILWLPTNLSIS